MDTIVLAIGNRLMGDDGVGIRVLEVIEKDLNKAGINTVIGETDFNYCIDRIKDGDLVIIIDSMISGKEVGEIELIPLNNYLYNRQLSSQHSLSLITLLNLYREDIRGYLIGIEVSLVEFNIELSTEIEDKLQCICDRVLNLINSIRRN